jgi:hypothetical protein
MKFDGWSGAKLVCLWVSKLTGCPSMYEAGVHVSFSLSVFPKVTACRRRLSAASCALSKTGVYAIEKLLV